MILFLNKKHSSAFSPFILLLLINVSFSYYFDNTEEYPVNIKPMAVYNKVHSKPQSMYFFYPYRFGWPMERVNENENKKTITPSKNKRSIINEHKFVDDSEEILNGRNIRSPLGTMRFGKRGQFNELPLSDEDFSNWILYNKRTMRPNPLGTMRFGK
uniref:Uncharacterized protein n=1 Tax=Strongyloides papillosus TaxID=174720 RepID=A0A0N5C965_STREA